MENIAGPPVVGENFHGRERKVESLWQLLQQHDILLLGPRRIGKTSVARTLAARAEHEGWRYFEINVASCRNEREVVEKLVAAVHEHARSQTARTLGSIRNAVAELAGRVKRIAIPGGPSVDLEGTSPEPWDQVASAALQILADSGEQWLAYVDELPIFLFQLIREDPVHGVGRTRRFLDWFRNDVRGLRQGRHLHWLITGSVGLDTLVQQHKMSDTINSLKHETLPPFTDPEALGLLRKLSASYALALTDSHCRFLLDRIRWPQPYYLQLAFNNLRELLTGSDTQLDEIAIDKAVQNMLAPSQDNDFHHWKQRLETQLAPDQEAHATAMLKVAAAQPEGTRVESLLACLASRLPATNEDDIERVFITLRDILIRDAYWLPEDGPDGIRRYRFQLEPLRAWWKRQHAL